MLDQKSDAIFFTTTKDDNTGCYVSDILSLTLMPSKKLVVPETPTGGYRYHILIHKDKEVEAFQAILGDSYGYVDRLCSLGYSGLILKKYEGIAKRAAKAFKAKLQVLGITRRSEVSKILKELQCIT